MKNKIKILGVLLFLSFLISMNIWFTWGKYKTMFGFSLSIILMLFSFNNKNFYSFSKTNNLLFIIITATYSYFYLDISNFKEVLKTIWPIFQFYNIIYLKNDLKIVCLHYITKWFCYLLIPSLILFLILLFVDIPPINYLKSNYESTGLWNNYLIVIKGYYGIRFSGPFLEPGHLGMITAMLIYANGFNLKNKYIKILAFINLFTLSLAAYVLLFIGYCFNAKLKFKYIVVGLTIVIGSITIAKHYNDGNNLVNNLILERLDYDSDKGFKGNNRVSDIISTYYDDMWKYNNFWWGYGSDTVSELRENGAIGTGFTMFSIEYGILGCFLALSFYFTNLFFVRKRRFALLFFIFILFVFWQRSYPYWTSWIICYNWGILNADSFYMKPLKNIKR